MSYIEVVSKDLSNKLGERLNKTEEEINVINYGLFVLLNNIFNFVVILILAIVTNMFYEVMCISISSAIFKRYSGGKHATSPTRCTIIGIIFALALGVTCKFIVNKIDFIEMSKFMAILFMACAYVLYKKCPVPSKNKPMKNPATRKRLRKKAFIAWLVVFMVELLILVTFKWYNIEIMKTIFIAILLGMLLQTFVLTEVGGKTIEGLDKLLEVVI